MIVVVFFAPQGIIGAVRQIRANFVRVMPVPPPLPEGAHSITDDIDVEATHA